MLEMLDTWVLAKNNLLTEEEWARIEEYIKKEIEPLSLAEQQRVLYDVNMYLLELLSHQRERSSRLRKEIQRFNKIKTIAPSFQNTWDLPRQTQENENNDSPLEDKAFPLEECYDLKSELDCIVPFTYTLFSKTILQFFSNKVGSKEKQILNALYLEYQKEMKESKEILETMPCTLEEKEEFVSEINVCKKKLEAIKKFKSRMQVEVLKTEPNEEKKKNKILFARKQNGNIRLLSDIENYHLTSEQCGAIYDQIQKLEMDDLRIDVQRYREQYRDIYKVRDLAAQTRLCFRKVDENIYLILGVFIKKDNWALASENKVSSLHQLYVEQIDFITSYLTSSQRDTYLKMAETALKTVYNVLEEKAAKTRPFVYEKRRGNA